MTVVRKVSRLFALAVLFAPGAAAAQGLWHPLDSKPKPNMVVGLDTSVTMGINSNCSSCHRDNPFIQVRLDDARSQIGQALPLFKDLFIYGGFQYEGCGSAHIVRRELPNPSDHDDSLARVQNMLSTADHCNSSEDYLPGGSAGTCITAGCAGDAAIGQQVLTGGLPSLTLPTPPASWTSTCTAPQPSLNLLTTVLMPALPPTIWPTLNDGTAQEADESVCTPIQNALIAANNALVACRGDQAAASAVWDLSGYIDPATRSSWCNPQSVANTVCTGASPFNGTCVCDDTLPWCSGGGIAASPCGTPVTFKYRQQRAICEAYDPGSFGGYFAAQTDNITNPQGCRENVALLFTDGYMGDRPGVALEALGALGNGYTSAFGETNMFVFHVSGEFTAHATALANYLSAGNPSGPLPYYDATSQTDLLASFARIVNRVYRGVYSGANLTFDRYSQRAVAHVFSVLGTPLPAGSSAPGQDYLGRPSRLVMMRVDDQGNVDWANPVFETDWTGKAGLPPIMLGGLDNPRLGPNAPFRTGTPRVVTIPRDTVDRNGDNAPDNHEPLTWGYMLGGSTTQPVIVDAPREIPAGATGAGFSAFLSSVANRPRVIYTWSTGYLHAIHGGVRVNTPTYVGKTNVAFTYDDSVPNAGTEIFRYKPPWNGWLDTVADADLNDIVPRPLTTGQIVVREMQVGNPGNAASDYATILVAAQGRDGRGLAILDVTNPLSPSVRRQLVLPNANDRASNEPMLYQWPSAAGTRPVVVMTGGVGGSANIYAIDAWGALATQVRALPGGTDYPTEPVCLGADGRTMSQCYVLGRNGRLIRVPVNASGWFGIPEDITPPGVANGSRVFLTRPVVFFGADNSVNIAYGSGDSLDLLSPTPAGGDVFVKVRDNSNRLRAGSPQATIAGACAADASNSTTGVFALGNQRVVSAPIISKGVLAWTTYEPGSTGCNAGQARLYAANFERCNDAFDPNALRPQPRDIGPGIPTSPSLLRGPEKIVTQTSASGTQPRTDPTRLQTRGGDKIPLRRLFWRPVMIAR